MPQNLLRSTILVTMLLCIPALAKSHSVRIEKLKYIPATVQLAPGDTVVWTNADDRDHTVSGEGIASGKLASGESYEQAFDKPGTFSYGCDFHPRMKGKVVVK